jgi:hypothetical protein
MGEVKHKLVQLPLFPELREKPAKLYKVGAEGLIQSLHAHHGPALRAKILLAVPVLSGEGGHGNPTLLKKLVHQGSAPLNHHLPVHDNFDNVVANVGSTRELQ